MGRKDDPDLAPDAALAVEDTVERRAEQLAHLGGEPDDIDDFDPSGLDDGSNLDYEPPEDEDEEDNDAADENEDGADDDGDDSDEAADADGEGDSDDGDTDVDEGEDEEEDSPPAQKGIPKHRFDEVNERRKAAEAELAALKAKETAVEEAEEEVYDFRANEKEYIDLVLDGDTEAALAKREEIDAAKETKWKADSKQETRTDIESDAELSELVGLSREAEQMFDVFNPEHEGYNQDMLNKVMIFMRGYETEMSRADAFVAGLADVVEMYDLMPDEEAADPDPEPKPTGKKKVDKKKAKVKEQAHTPVAGEGAGSDDAGAAAPNIDDMTDEEFDALPEKTQARLRGDFV